MKYLNLTAIKSFAIFCLIILFTSITQAQTTSNSPYSRYGIGLVRPVNFNSNFGSGGIGYAWRPSVYKPIINDSLAKSSVSLNDRRTNYINSKNPASLSNLSLTTFETGLFSRNTQSESTGQSSSSNNSTISHIAMGFPISDNLGASFGLRSFSSIGYEYETITSLNEVNATKSYNGSGGLNEFFLGFGYELTKFISVGVSGKYIFGKIERENKVSFDGSNATNFFNTLDVTSSNVSTITYDVGIQYFKMLNKDFRFVLGITASPIDKFSAKQSGLIATYTGSEGFERIKDTISSTEDKKIELPSMSSYGAGISIEKLGKWAAAFDFTNQGWGDVKVEQGIYLRDSYLLNIGFEKFNSVQSFGSLLKRIGYRGGFRYNSSIIEIDDVDISEMAVSAGVSIPLRKSFSTLNFGIELGRRGEIGNGLTQEDFINLQFGLTINDRWFIQRKYD